MDKLINFRKENNLTQEQLAKMLDVKKSQISRWESGESKPNLKSKNKLEKLFNEYKDELTTIKYNATLNVANELIKLALNDNRKDFKVNLLNEAVRMLDERR